MRVRARRRILGAGVAVATVFAPAHRADAQRLDGARAGVVAPRSAEGIAPLATARGIDRDLVYVVSSTDSGEARRKAVPRFSAHIRSLAPLGSALVPGTGQFVLGDDRFVAYAAIELLGWLKYAKDSREQASQEASFRDLARRVARAASPNRPDGNWTYYEAMRDFISSGQYTTATDGSVVPSTDPHTFNGNQWLLALRTTPDSAAALAQYERLAYKTNFEWSWDNAQLQWDIFKRTTFKRDDAHYAGVQDLIVIGANHFLSMVDAFATFRLSMHTDDSGRTSVGASVRW